MLACQNVAIYFGTLGSLLDIQHSSDILPRAVTVSKLPSRNMSYET